MDDVARQWAGDPDVTEMTDVDLTASRRDNSNVSDPSRELHRLAYTVMEYYDYPTISWTLDTALRVELARLIDTDTVSFGRDDFDIRYTIPQEGWYDEQDFSEIPLLDDEDVDTSERGLNFSSVPVVLGMADRVVHEQHYDSISATVKGGLQTLAGRR